MTGGNPSCADDGELGRIKLIVGLLTCTLLVTACAGSAGGPSTVELTAAGKLVRELENQGAAKSCRSLGKVVGPPPYLLPSDGINRMKNRTGALGGNALLVTNYLVGIASGVAYRC